MAKSRPTMNLVSKIVASSSTAQSSSASNCPGILRAPSQSLSLIARAGKPAAKDSNQNDAASSSQLFDVSQKLTTDQTEIQGISKNGWYTHPWQRTTLLSDKAVQPLTAKVYVFSVSVLCLGRMHPHPESVDAWKKKIEWFTDTPQYRELDRVDGEQWNSSGKFSQESQHYRFSLKFRK